MCSNLDDIHQSRLKATVVPILCKFAVLNLYKSQGSIGLTVTAHMVLGPGCIFCLCCSSGHSFVVQVILS